MAIHAFAAPAAAEPTPEQREADEQFQQGKALMEQGAVREACAKFARSLEILRRGGTLLNLAVCRQKEGRRATALVLFQDALAAAAADGRADREEIARRGIEEVRAKLSWLTVSLAPGAEVPGLVVTRDGAPLDRAAWGAITPVDPGPHAVVATAPGRVKFEATVDVGPEGDRKVIEIPVLATPRLDSPPPDAPRAPPPPPPPAWKLPLGISAIGVGAVGLGVGGVFGVKAILDSHESKRLCPERRCTTDPGIEKNQSARTAATIANVALPVGAIVAGAGIFLLAWRPAARPARAASLWAAPICAPPLVGASLGGAW
jgi:tetratricopeptide (TPR) repeat protein